MRAPFGAFHMSRIGSNTDNRSWLYGKVRDLPWLTFEGRWLSANQIFPGACFFKIPISVIYRFFHVHHCCNKHWILVIHHVHCPTFWDVLPRSVSIFTLWVFVCIFLFLFFLSVIYLVFWDRILWDPVKPALKFLDYRCALPHLGVAFAAPDL